MRIVIVGGGVIGLLTAVRCVSAGHEVILVDQSAIPSSGAASFDRHRVLRALDQADPSATAAAVRAHRLWLGLQHLLSTRFYELTGVLNVLPPEHLAAAQTVLTSAGSPARTLGPGELASSYPQVRFPDGAGAVFESLAGVLLADRLLTACAGWLRRHPGAELRPYNKAVGADVDGPAVRLACGEVVRGDALLLATGPWSRALLTQELASQLVLYRQSMLYCQVPAPAAAAWAATPPIRSLGTDGGTWLMPPVGGTPLKLSTASACRATAEVDGNATPPYWRDHLVDAVAATVPGLSASWLTGTRDCYYLARAVTGGGMLAVLADRVAAYPACGGLSFKFAPLIAQSLAERLTGADPAPTGLYWIDDGAVHVPPGTAGGRRQTTVPAARPTASTARPTASIAGAALSTAKPAP